MAALTVEQSIITGLDLTFNAAGAGGDTFTNNGRTIIIVKNDSGGAINVTAITDYTAETTLALDDRVVNVNAADIVCIGPFDSAFYSVLASTVSLTYSATASITVAVLKI